MRDYFPFSKPIKPTESWREIAVERVHSLTPEVFYQRFLSGIGKPVIVTDTLSGSALSKWDFDFFKSRYGSDSVLVTAGLYSKCMKIMKLRDYIDYLDTPTEKSQGFWIDPITRYPCAEPPEVPTAPLYLVGWNAFDRHPELLEDFEVSPRFVEDWLPLVPRSLRDVLNQGTKYFSTSILVGPKGSVARLHCDFLHTHGYLAQITGRKKCVLFSPEDSAALYDGKVDPDQPDLQTFPLFRQATSFHCTLEPGEVLFTPSCWWHHVVGMEKSITVSYNFFNRTNYGAYMTDLLQQLPTVLEGLKGSPDLRAALGIKWVCKGFEFPVEGKS